MSATDDTEGGQAAPLHGYLVEGDGDHVLVEVPGGTWLVPSADADVTEWATPTFPGEGTPVEVRVPVGTNVQFLRTVTVVAGPPMTLPTSTVEVLGAAKIADMSTSFAVAPDAEFLGDAQCTSYSWEFSVEDGITWDGHAVDCQDYELG